MWIEPDPDQLRRLGGRVDLMLRGLKREMDMAPAESHAAALSLHSLRGRQWLGLNVAFPIGESV